MLWWGKKKPKQTIALPPFDPANGRLVVGRYADGTPATLTLKNQSGVVVGGVPGSGKTAGLVIISLALLRAGAHLYVVDGKGGDDWGWIEPAATDYVKDDLQEVHEKVLSINADMKARLASMRENYGNSNYWNVPPAQRPPLEVLIVDECQTFFDAKSVIAPNVKDAKKLAGEITAAVTDIVKKGRSAGYLVFVMTQKPTADSIPTALRDNCGLRVCFRISTQEAAKSVLGELPDGSPSPVDIPRNRVGGAVLCRDDGTAGMCRFAYIDEEHASTLVQAL